MSSEQNDYESKSVKPDSTSAQQLFVENTNETSALISSILKLENVSHDELQLIKKLTFIPEYCCRISYTHLLGFLCSKIKFCYDLGLHHFKHSLECIFTGSELDCSFTTGSDIDQMITWSKTEVTYMNECFLSQAENVLITNTNNCTPGYTYLHPYKLWPYIREKGCTLSEGVEYLSSEKCLTDLTGRAAKFLADCPYTETRQHGPCINLLLKFVEFNNYTIDTDTGIGLKCSCWPNEAMEWVSRDRKSNWPDQSLINKIKEMPCHVLPIGYPLSDKCHLEWRFAFVLQERELIWNFNDVQIQSYVILKALKKEFLDKLALDEINSFHLKTIVFWLSEEDTISWEPSHLLHIVKRSLSFLSRCIQQRHLSHYFLRSRNLLAGKLTDKNLRDSISTEIIRIQRNVLHCFLQCSWRPECENYYLSKVRSSLQEQRTSVLSDICKQVLQSHKGVNMHVRFQQISLSWIKGIDDLDIESLTELIKKLTHELKDTVLEAYLLPLLYFRLGMFYLVRAKSETDKGLQKKFFTEAKTCFETRMKHDRISSIMYLLTYCYEKKDYADIRSVLATLYGGHTTLQYHGTPGFVSCGKRSFLSTNMNENVIEKDITNANDIAFDVIFISSDWTCLPPALQYECFF